MMNNEVNRNQIGQYDLAKGLSLIAIAAFHTLGVIGFSSRVANSKGILLVLGAIVKFFGIFTIPLFFMISGLGYRSTKIKSCIKKQSRYLLVPYVITAIITCVVNLCIHYACFRYFKGSVEETKKIAFSYIFGNENATSFLGHDLFQIGPLWFVLALFIAWNILNIISNIFKNNNKMILIVSAGFMLAGYVIILIDKNVPYCIPQAFITVFLLELGYVIKKKKLLFTKISFIEIVAAIALGIISLAFGDINMAENIWKLGLVDMLAAIVIAYVALKIFLKVNRFENGIVTFIRTLGKNSMWFVCVHEVELVAIPWYKLVEKFENHIFFVAVFIFLVRMCMIVTGVFAIGKINRFINKRKNRKEIY